MSEGKYCKAIRDKIFPAIHKKINAAYMSCNELKREQLELEVLTEIYNCKKSQACKKVNEFTKKRQMVEKRKHEESVEIASVMEQTKKKIEKIQVRNDQFEKLHDQLEEMTISLEERVDTLRQRKIQYFKHLAAYKPCKDLITAVAKLWPTVLTEFELLQRLETLIEQKVRFSEEYKEMNHLHEVERKKLFYEDAEMDMIILSNRLDELEQERKDVNEAIQKEEEIFHRMMDTSSEVEAAFSEVRLGSLRLYNLTKPRVKTMDPLEQLTIVLEFGQLLHSVSETLGKSSET